MLAKMLANLVTKPGQAPLFDDPSNYELDYENVEFDAADGVTLRGWLINPGKENVIIQSHFGVQCSRAGYTVAGKTWPKGYHKDIHFLQQVKHLAAAGYTVLAYDLRHHGESDPGPNPWICDGQEEYRDVIAAVQFINNHPDYQSSKIGLLSLCMGSSSTFNAFGIPNGLEHVPNIAAMVVQPLYSGGFFLAMGVPRFFMNRAARYSKKRGGADFSQSPLDRVKHINVPTLVMQNRNDPWYDKAYLNGVFEGLQVEKEMLWVESEKQRLAGYGYFGEHPEKMLEWFNKHLPTEPGTFSLNGNAKDHTAESV